MSGMQDFKLLLARRAGPFNPVSGLGASLLGYFDAENAGSITQSGGLVSNWVDPVTSLAVTAAGTQRPTYSAAGLNGRPCLVGDGVNVIMTSGGNVSYPIGANDSEIWVLVRQNALVADATIRPAVSYGSANARMMAREVVGGVNRAEARRATANSTSSVDFSGIHAVRAIFTGVSTISTDVDAIAGTPGADTGSTVAGVMNIFSAFALFWNGSINSIWITAPLTAGQAAQMWAYLKTRGGIA